ncbi:glycosyltransferase [Winogradskyella pulchriflava]|uniref:Glycosyltransferase n=1 Tax=Winogradskyella pulchriflava TaxID=1110688 RepID=A0ABV6QCD7_9FLAO
MIKTSTKKICIVVSSLGIGGAERSSALLSEILFDLGFQVHIVSVLHYVDYPYKGELLNLGELKLQDDSRLGRLKRLRVFHNYIKQHDFDYVIDNRTRIGFFKELVISKWVYSNQNVIYYVHSYNTDNYINPNRLLGKYLYGSVTRIVSVSKAIADKLKHKYGFNRITTIYNPIPDLTTQQIIDDTSYEPYILYFGRLDDKVKNISLLIDAYDISVLKKNNVKLKILGDGEDKDMLQEKVKTMNLSQFVEFLPFNPGPYNIVKNAYFTVLTSRYEGFPMVIPESLALGTPVVSVDCKSGPNEVIIHEENGLLVENDNIEALTKAMNRMLEDKDLYLQCKSNAKKSVEKFSKDDIKQQWKTLLK